MNLEEALNVLKQLKDYYLNKDPNSDVRVFDVAMNSIIAWETVQAELESELDTTEEFPSIDYMRGIRKGLRTVRSNLRNLQDKIS